MSLCCALVVGTPPVIADVEYRRSGGVADLFDPLVVAGYRALFTCSAHFFAGRPLDDIRKIELADTAHLDYPDPVIDAVRRTVSAADKEGNVQIAAYRDSMGCTVLPQHWDETDAHHLPYVELGPAPDMSNVGFPAGDRVSLDANGYRRGYAYLADVVQNAFDGDSYGEGYVTISVLIIKDGKLLAEQYRSGFGVHSGYRTWSTAKSISAAVMGVAHGQGIYDVNGTADVPEWQFGADPRRQITYKQLFWMSSGLAGGGNNTYAVYFGGQDVVSAITSTELLTDPGTTWRYANNDTLLLLRALRHRINDDTRYMRYPYDELLHRIGMYHTRMESDHLGNFVGSSQVYTTARDLARFGVLLADDGVWQGQRILPEGWVEFLRAPAPTRPAEKDEWGYGAQFWLLGEMPGVPANAYTSAGNKGQFVSVVPDDKLVIVRTGVNPIGSTWDQEKLVAAVVRVIDEH
ncbi:MAG: serine hydrolase [Gammaproteobacteria bacterium]|nr:serine hydrolase [Gammaproteobacteria bacterium]